MSIRITDEQARVLARLLDMSIQSSVVVDEAELEDDTACSLLVINSNYLGAKIWPCGCAEQWDTVATQLRENDPDIRVDVVKYECDEHHHEHHHA